MPPVVQTINLSKSYSLGKQDLPVLNNINLEVQKGEFAAIMGPSGSGKSTLLNILGCLDIPTTGQYLLAQRPVDKLSEDQLSAVRNQEIGFVFQNFNLLPKLDIFGNIELPLIYANVALAKRKTLTRDIMEKLGVWDRRKHRPNEISGGQKQRVALARALVKHPSLILADEPTGNLDSTTTLEIMDLLKTLHEEGQTILLITHEKEVAQRAQRVLHLNDGQLS